MAYKPKWLRVLLESFTNEQLMDMRMRCRVGDYHQIKVNNETHEYEVINVLHDRRQDGYTYLTPEELRL